MSLLLKPCPVIQNSLFLKPNFYLPWFSRAYGSVFGKVCAKDYGQMDEWAGFHTDLWMRDRAFY